MQLLTSSWATDRDKVCMRNATMRQHVHSAQYWYMLCRPCWVTRACNDADSLLPWVKQPGVAKLSAAVCGYAHSLLAWVEDLGQEEEQRVDDQGPKVLKEEDGRVVNLQAQRSTEHEQRQEWFLTVDSSNEPALASTVGSTGVVACRQAGESEGECIYVSAGTVKHQKTMLHNNGRTAAASWTSMFGGTAVCCRCLWCAKWLCQPLPACFMPPPVFICCISTNAAQGEQHLLPSGYPLAVSLGPN